MHQLVIIGASPEGLAVAHWCVAQYPEIRIALITQGWEPALSGDRHWTTREEDFWESLDLLAARGVDVVAGNGTLHSSALGLRCRTENRELLGEKYLLTSFRKNHNPEDAIDIPQASSPQRWAMVGTLPENLVLAQQLTKQGHQVDILSRNRHLLPGENREMVNLLQWYLESLGINFWFDCYDLVSHHDQCRQTYNLQFRQGVSESLQNLIADKIIHPRRSPLPPQLLEDVPELLLQDQPYLTVNNFLQTTHPQIYACGNWLKGYSCPLVAKEEAQYIVKQIVEKSPEPINYQSIPFGIDLDPPWYRIGLTQDDSLQIIRGFEPYRDHCDLRGVCRLTLNDQGKIVGGHWFGQRGQEGVYLLELAIAKGLDFEEFRRLSRLEPW